MSAVPLILAVEHALGGGVRKHVRDLQDHFRGRARFLTLAPAPGGLLKLEHDFAHSPHALYFDPRRELDVLYGFLRECALTRIHFHHLIQLPWDLTSLPRVLGVPYDFTAHDYYSYCPQITLTSETYRYCGEPDEAGCTACLASRPAPGNETIAAWRQRQKGFVEGAARVLVPVRSVGARLQRHFPGANIVVAPHPERIGVETSRKPAWGVVDGNLRVLVLGALTPTKGPDLLEAAAVDARRRHLPIEYHLLGSAYRSLAVAPQSTLTVHGPYDEKDLPWTIERLEPHVAWFPAQWPETYSYTLSEAMRSRLPIIAPAMGAFLDRMAGQPFNWLVPSGMQGDEVNDLLMALKQDARAGDAYLVPVSPGASAGFSYDTDYLPALDSASDAHTQPRISRRFARSWRLSADYLSGALRARVVSCLKSAYALPGVRRVAATLFREHKLQTLRKRLGGY